MMKINPNSMKKVYEELLNTFCKKNHDYGSSFELSLDKHGLVAGVVRMEDKMNRLSTLVDSDTDAQIASESLVDTLMDLSNYSAMAACWLMGQDEKTRVKHKNLSATWKPAPEDITNFVENTNNKIVREGTTGRDNIKADMEHDTEVICRAVRDSKDKPLLTDPKGLENGYFIRQHTNPEDSSRYTLAFSPEGTVKTQLGDELPYVIECFGNNYDGMTRWAIHVFNTRQDMVAALNYDLKVRDRYSSKNFGDSIGELNITKDVFKPENTTPVFAAWMDIFGEPFIKNMTSRDIFIDGYFSVKTFSTVFISEKTGALVVKGLTGENTHFNPLYNNMEDKILYIFNSWDGSELKNLVFFNEGEPLNNEIREKRMQIPGDLSEKKSGDTDGSDDF